MVGKILQNAGHRLMRSSIVFNLIVTTSQARNDYIIPSDRLSKMFWNSTPILVDGVCVTIKTWQLPMKSLDERPATLTLNGMKGKNHIFLVEH